MARPRKEQEQPEPVKPVEEQPEPVNQPKKEKKCVISNHPTMPDKCSKGLLLAECSDSAGCKGFVPRYVAGLPPAELSVCCPHCAKMLVIRNKTGMVK